MSSNVPGNAFPIRAPHVEQTASCPPKRSSRARLINPGIPPLFKLYPVGQGSSNVPGNMFPIRDPHIHILSFCWPRARGLAEHPWMVVCDPYGVHLSQGSIPVISLYPGMEPSGQGFHDGCLTLRTQKVLEVYLRKLSKYG